MKKKALSVLLSTTMAAGMLSGAVTTVAADEPYEMVMQIINYGFDDPALQDVEDAVNELTVPEIGVKVKFMTTPIMEQASKLGLLISGGEKVDLVQAGLLLNPSIFAAQGLIQPITEYVESSEPLMTLADGIIDACKVGDEIYAYPGSIQCGVQVDFFYDADLAEEYGIEVPEILDTQEKWDDLFSQILESGMPQYGISLGDGIACEYEWADFDPLGDAANLAYGVIMNDDDTVMNYYSSEEYAAKCAMHHDWFMNGYCVPDSISNGYTTIDSMTQGMNFGFVSNGGVGMSDAYWTKTTGKNIKSVPMSAQVSISSDNVVNTCWGVASSCENPAKVVEFLEMLYTNTDLANLMNYGIEGEHYVTTEGSQIIAYPEGKDSMSVGYGSFVGSYGDQSKIYQFAPLTDEFVEAIPDFGYPNAVMTKYMGYTFDASNVAAEVAAVQATVAQYAPALECGTVEPDDYIPQFLEALETAGMSKIIEENQAQLDAWLAAK